MKFSMIFEAQMTDIRDEHKVIRECLEQAVYADQLGFDRVWAVEHHALKNYAHMSASEIFLSYVAARTENIRIGHGVICLPFNFNHPVRVAERTAMLDVLSGGRVDVGAGRGATLTEMSLYGVDPERTYQEMEESLRIVAHAWTHRELEWEGDLLSIHPPEGGVLHVVPKPVQKPHPPLFMACTHKETLRMAADWGVGALVLGFGGPSEMEKLHTFYREAVDARSEDTLVSPGVTNDFFGALCPTIVLDDREEAILTGLRGQRFFAESISHYYGGGPIPSGVVEEGIDERAAIKQAEETFVAKLHEMEIPVDPAVPGNYNPDQAYGNADDAIAHVEALQAVGVDEVMCLIQMGMVSQEVAMETIRQWGEKIIPHFRAQEAAGVAAGASSANG
jgi:alkanesulfonate monooxygenase SsuD/methylene tetrahydromethanopterin reductase-like flavin-dependent oxidoreductase (luciferase family)